MLFVLLWFRWKNSSMAKNSKRNCFLNFSHTHWGFCSQGRIVARGCGQQGTLGGERPPGAPAAAWSPACPPSPTGHTVPLIVKWRRRNSPAPWSPVCSVAHVRTLTDVVCILRQHSYKISVSNDHNAFCACEHLAVCPSLTVIAKKETQSCVNQSFVSSQRALIPSSDQWPHSQPGDSSTLWDYPCFCLHLNIWKVQNDASVLEGRWNP